MLDRLRREPVLAAAVVIVAALIGLDLSDAQVAAVVSVIAVVVRQYVSPTGSDK